MSRLIQKKGEQKKKKKTFIYFIKYLGAFISSKSHPLRGRHYKTCSDVNHGHE